MIELQAHYYDGRSAERHEVRLQSDGHTWLRVRGAAFQRDWPLAQVRVSARVGSARRTLRFPDESLCETDDNDAVDRMVAARAPRFERLLHLWESRFTYALAALLLTAAAGGAGIVWGIPALAKRVAFAMPDKTEALIGRDALAALDEFMLAPSQLPPARQEELQAHFARMRAGIEGAGDYRLELRAGGPLGANALALPSGIVVLTDELARLAADERELQAVLAHEIGHLRQRHSLRHVLQNSATSLIVAATLGDVTSLASVAATAPLLLAQARYSREFEREADAFALEWLARHGIPAQAFATILERMEAQRKGSGVPDYLSTHPGTRERAAQARGAR